MLLFDNSRFLKLISSVLPLKGFSFLKGAEQTKIDENKNKITVFDIKLVFFKYQKSLKNYLYHLISLSLLTNFIFIIFFFE